jgi:hypothetical protein
MQINLGRRHLTAGQSPPADSYDGLGDQLPPLGRVGQVGDVVDGIQIATTEPAGFQNSTAHGTLLKSAEA